ncbi:helix-turn-helix domain-containing protein [Streptacidiphilus rugosus]|uniref:helix-turn-helix domain-containing protein n=1 Tax=Streptacidiphilus rugosus TaxID=405783 RepID=UPI00068B3AB4|nr:helix-turn-helix domain-containing protein [Streptacidiphilus rugosus]
MQLTEPGPFLGELIRTHRRRRGVTQRQLADLSTVSIRTIRELERGRAHRPRSETLRLISDALRLSGRERVALAEGAVEPGVHAAALPPGRPPYDEGPALAGSPGAAVVTGAAPGPVDLQVGRGAETDLLVELLRDGADRLAVITGVPGVGKTRLALEVAARLHREEGFAVSWLSHADRDARERIRSGDLGPDLFGRSQASADAPRLVVLDAMDATGTQVPGHGGALAGSGPLGTVAPDERAQDVRELLTRHRSARVLCTARTGFAPAGARRLPLWPLAVPGAAHESGPVESLARVPAVHFLTRHIRELRPDFRLDADNARVVAELCRALDGIPAALAEASALFLFFEPEEMSAQLRTTCRALAGERLTDLDHYLAEQQRGLTAEESGLLTLLTEREWAWTVREAAELAGLTLPASSALVQKLLLKGLVRPAEAGARTTFLALRMLEGPVALAATDRGPLHSGVA